MALMVEPVTTGSTSSSIPIRGVNLLHLHPASACSHSCRLTAWFSCCWDSLSGCHTCSALPWKAASGESRQRTSSTAGAAGSCTLPGLVQRSPNTPLPQEASFLPLSSALQAPSCLSLAVVFKALLQNSFVFFSVIIAVSHWVSRCRRYIFIAGSAPKAYLGGLPCARTCFNGPGQRGPAGAHGHQSSREGVNKGFNTKRPHSKAQVRASCTPPPGLHPAVGALAGMQHSSASFPTSLLPHLCDVKQSFCFLFKTLASGAITGKKKVAEALLSEGIHQEKGVFSLLRAQGAAPAFALLQGHLVAPWSPPPCSRDITSLLQGHLTAPWPPPCSSWPASHPNPKMGQTVSLCRKHESAVQSSLN